jgi:hypothetical protein
LSNIETAEKQIGGDPFAEALGDAWEQSADQVEAELFYGGQRTDATGYNSHPITMAEGMDNYITTNVFSASRLSRMDFFDILVEWQKYNKFGGAILCSLQFKSLVTSWAMNVANYNIGFNDVVTGGNIGLGIDRVTWMVGTFDLIDVDLLNQNEYLAGDVFLSPKGLYAFRPLVGNGENYNIRYRPINRDEVHAREGEIYGIYGHEFFLQEAWAKITGLQF